jgi:hypothetical protein
MFSIIEFFLGLSIGGAILWVTILGLVKFTRRVMAGELWQDALKNLWEPPALPGNSNTPRHPIKRAYKRSWSVGVRAKGPDPMKTYDN